mmetsp:Transcript_9486/g.23735  ORF Transcript_9486/g.23735 Transcript_9486/m.23735 type:complete len:329 (-) Transcript_9486:42-1028(-)
MQLRRHSPVSSLRVAWPFLLVFVLGLSCLFAPVPSSSTACAQQETLSSVEHSSPETASEACLEEAGITAELRIDFSASSSPGGWIPFQGPALLTNSRVQFPTPGCNIDRLGCNYTIAQFRSEYQDKWPVILGCVDDQSAFLELSARDRLLEEFADSTVVLSTANSYSHEKRRLTFGRYVREIVDHPWTGDELADRSYYHFGDHNHSEWALLFDAYRQPTHLLDYDVQGSMSFGVGASGSGVPMHVHGPVFAEVFYGAKRWFLYAPDQRPPFDPDITSMNWLQQVYPTLPASQLPFECVCHPGDLLYIPSEWYHSTLNLGQTVFMSTFV